MLLITLVIGIYFLSSLVLIPSLYSKINDNKEIITSKDIELSKKDTEILKLEQQLTPFKTVALEKFSNEPQDAALSALAQRIGQIELNVISLFDYQEISTWSFFGSMVKKLGAITSTGGSPAADWNKNYVQRDNIGNVIADCSNDAIKTYLDTIQRFDLYPFPYYVLSICQQKNKQPEWQANWGKAYKIVSMTTKIPNHHPDHDVLLYLLTHPK